MVAQDYPVTQPYGYDPSYPLNGGYHRGIDYGCPTGTDVVVNGVTIGLSGATGAVTGPHLHIGKFVNGKVQDPGVKQGFSFKNAVVNDIGYDSTNGNFVRINADGALWVYLHLSKINVKAGQKLQGVDEMITKRLLEIVIGMSVGRAPTQAEVDNWVGKNELGNLLEQYEQTSERAEYYKTVQAGFKCLNTLPGINKESVIKYVQDNLK